MDMPAHMTEANIEKWKLDYFKPAFRVINKIYIDVECLKDFNLGALLSYISTQIEYSYILSKLTDYNLSHTKDVVTCFPALKIDRSLFDKHRSDINNYERICVGAPNTSIFMELPDVLDEVIKYNNRFEKAALPTIVFNYRNGVYPVKCQKMMNANILAAMGIQFNIQYICEPYADIIPIIIEHTDMFFVYDIQEFINTKSVHDTFTSNPTYMNKHVLAPRLLTTVLNDKLSIEDNLKLQGTTLRLAMDFRYIDMDVIT